MTESKGWEWENEDRSSWLKPAEDCVYLALKWNELGFRDILDLGSGLGRHTIHFARQGFNVSAMDLSEYGVRHLKTWAKSENLPITAQVGDMLSLPYPDESFDGVFTYHVINHTDTAGEKKVISEIERVMRPGGEAFLTFSSKEAAVYVSGTGVTRIDENSLVMNDGPEKSIPHFHVDYEEIFPLLCNFSIEKIRKVVYYNPDLGENWSSPHFYVSAARK